MTAYEKLSDRVNLVLKNIKEKDHTHEGLINFFNNINADENISEYEREILIDQVEKTLRLKHPKQAKKIFGSKDNEAKELLQNVLTEVTEQYDWSKNRVGSHVKVGGTQINGTHYVCIYISYKNAEGVSSGLAYKQCSLESEPFLEVHLRQVRTKQKVAEMVEEMKYSLSELNEARSQFIKNLKLTLS